MDKEKIRGSWSCYLYITVTTWVTRVEGTMLLRDKDLLMAFSELHFFCVPSFSISLSACLSLFYPMPSILSGGKGNPCVVVVVVVILPGYFSYWSLITAPGANKQYVDIQYGHLDKLIFKNQTHSDILIFPYVSY